MPSDVSSEKSALREQGLARRRTLSAAEYDARSKRVIARIDEVEHVRKARLVLTYAASKDNEVDTRPLIESMTYAGRRVAAPAVAPGRTMVWRVIAGLGDLSRGRFGILEPVERCQRIDIIPPDTVALVPGILFSTNGQRIGYGGGYFDRFLALFPGCSVGLAFDFQLVSALPEEPHDVRLDFVVSETCVHDCRTFRPDRPAFD